MDRAWHICRSFGCPELGRDPTTLVAYLIPAVGIVLGYLVLAEPIDAWLILGTGLIIAGIGLVNSRFGRRRRRTPAVEAPKPT